MSRRQDGSVYFTDWGGGSLDLSHPEVQAYVRDLAHRIGRDWGYGLFKLDGLWTGLANAQLYVHNPYNPTTSASTSSTIPRSRPSRPTARRFRLLREGAGDDVFILGCNVSQNMRSFAAAIGMVDAMRIGPDNGPGWEALKRGPWHGTNRWFLHRRIWYNDPDPLYVRASMPIEHARVITSWVAVTGTLHASSEWLPDLPPERLDLIKRALPAHRFPARPVDVLEQDLARIWIAHRPPAGRHVVGLFNWDDKKPARIECDLDPSRPACRQDVGSAANSGPAPCSSRSSGNSSPTSRPVHARSCRCAKPNPTRKSSPARATSPRASPIYRTNPGTPTRTPCAPPPTSSPTTPRSLRSPPWPPIPAVNSPARRFCRRPTAPPVSAPLFSKRAQSSR